MIILSTKLPTNCNIDNKSVRSKNQNTADIRGLFARLMVNQSTNWSTNCPFRLLIFVNQMNILVEELINKMTMK